MKTEFKKTSSYQAEVIIELSLEEVQPFLEKAAKRITKIIKIPGFREGNAPYEIVKEKIGETKIFQEALEPMIVKTLSDFISEKKIEVVSQPKIDILKMAPGDPFIYKATLTLLPEVILGDFRSLKLKRKKIEIKEEEINKIIDDLRKMRAKQTLVDREARKGDKVVVDIEMFLNKIPLEGGQSKDSEIVLGDSLFIPGLDEKLLGAKKGEVREFTLLYPQDHYDKKLAGKLVEFKVTIKSIYQIDIPELNEEFIQNLGRFKNLEELKNQLRDNLKLEKQMEEEEKLEREMIEKILSQTKIGEIPPLLKEQEIEKMIAELKEGVKQQGMEFSDYLVQIKKTEEELRKDLLPQAEKRIKTALILRKIAQKENIHETEEEVENEINQILKMYPLDENIRKQVMNKEYRIYLGNLITTKKTINFLKKIIIED